MIHSLTMFGLLFVSPGLQETELGKAAAALKPGEWVELKTEGLNRELFGGHDISIYSDKAVWNPVTKQVMFIGQDHLKPPPRFIIYDAGKNAWKAMPTPKWAEPLKWFHAYENNAIDPATGRFFHHPSASLIVHQFDPVKDEWTTLPELSKAPTGHGTALEFFPERKGLVRVLNGSVHFYDETTKAWSLLKDKLPMGPYHNVAAYSAKHKCVFFGGGNDSKNLYKLDADGKITPLREAPAIFGIGRAIITCDPVSGNFLIFASDDRVHRYDPVADSWNEVKTESPLAQKGTSHRILAIPIAEHGVIMFVTAPGKGGKVWLYRIPVK
ncbi:MAG: hypothetical protein K8T89_05455 [Planctomycetes bacterium]|nr:hypothetical protein [Planctomycetota bacterium]